MRRKLVAGNWKMNGLRSDGVALAQAVKTADIDIVLCPPFTLLGTLAPILSHSPIGLGAQDCHSAAAGAFTGSISAAMLADIGCQWVILGHSERRQQVGETNALIAAKATAARSAGLSVILCLGETEAERDAGQAATVTETQLRASLPPGSGPEGIVIAYEPVWAIGTGRTPTLADVADIHGRLRATLIDLMGDGGNSVRLLYGGSVKPANARDLLHLPDVDGALVGGASLNADDFNAIIAAAGAD
jgi:triosephosphate isomerase